MHQLIGQLGTVQWVWRVCIDDSALNCKGLGCGVCAAQHAASMALVVIRGWSEGEIVERRRTTLSTEVCLFESGLGLEGGGYLRAAQGP